MSTWHPTTKAARQPTHETTPPKSRASQFGCRGTLPRRQERSLSQPRLTTTQPPPRTGREPHDDEPSWHRLLGTLLSSQGTDAHPARPFDPPGGNRSNLAEWAPPVNLLGVSSLRGRPLQPDAAPRWRQGRHRVLSQGWPPSGTSHRSGPSLVLLGVRSSLPGDKVNTTQRPGEPSNRGDVTPITRMGSDQRRWCAGGPACAQ